MVCLRAGSRGVVDGVGLRGSSPVAALTIQTGQADETRLASDTQGDGAGLADVVVAHMVVSVGAAVAGRVVRRSLPDVHGDEGMVRSASSRSAL